MKMTPTGIFFHVPIDDESKVSDAGRQIREITDKVMRDAGIVMPNVEITVFHSKVLTDKEQLVGSVRVSLWGAAAYLEVALTAALFAAGFDPGQTRREDWNT